MISNARSINQGQAANYTGNQAERLIEDILSRKGILFARQFPQRSIYQIDVRADFMLHTAPGYPDGLIIESKWQMVGGSVDEKYPYLVLSIKQTYTAPTIIIMDGDGARPEAIQWCKRQMDGKHLLGVMTIGEFLKWAMVNL